MSSSRRIGPPSSASQRTSRTNSGWSSKNVNAARSMRSTCGQPSRVPSIASLDEVGPVRERREEHGAVERFLRREVVQQARAPDADLVGDVVQARARETVVAEAPQRHLEDEVFGRRTGTGRAAPRRQCYRHVPTDQSVVSFFGAAHECHRRRRRRVHRHAARDLHHDRLPPPRAVAPRADRPRSGRRPLPGRHLDDDGNAAARVGRGAPQAPRRDRHGRRPAQPDAGRVLARAARQRRSLQARAPPIRRTCRSTRATSRPISSTALAFDYSLVGLGIGIAILVVDDVGARLRAAHRLARGRAARGLLRDAVRRDQRGRAHARQAAVRELGDQSAVARVHHRRRGPAQQPPRRADVGAFRAAQRRDRSRLVGWCACS